MAAGDKRRKHTPVAQILYTETEPHRRNAAVSRRFERHSHVSWWRPDWLAGAGGLEPPNGGIKIHLISLVLEGRF
jgi:hypothetical protein